MIVKDEAKNIERLLNSVKASISYYVICDTGSSDGTPELIEKITKKLNIPGEIHHSKWINFGENRTIALNKAKESLDASKHDCDWVLIIDADEKLEVTDPFWYKKLEQKRSYMLNKKDKGVVYAVNHLLNIKHEKHVWKGPAHNYVKKIKGQVSKGVAKGVYILRDSSFKGGKSRKFKTPKEKYLYDAELFEKELVKNPKDSRSRFYLAQSYRDAKCDNLAIHHYLMRAEMENSWIQERYVSYLEAAKLLEKSDVERSLFFYLEAYNCLPSRAEAPTRFGYLANKTGRSLIGYSITSSALKTMQTNEYDLFRQTFAHEWGLLDAFQQNAASLGLLKEARLIINKILQKHFSGIIKLDKEKLENLLKSRKKYTTEDGIRG